MGVNIKKLNSPLLYNYRYDQLNRLTHMDAWKRTSTAWSALTATTDYQENVSYDPNGNILTYHRNRETTGSGNPMDQLQYSYIPGTNQLDHIYDTVPGVSNANDIATQSAGNYKYDSIGELIGDAASNITNITWTVYGKIASITKAPDTVIRYTYDPAGNRISKTVVHGVDSIVTWYVRDAQGNILSVYTSGDPAVNGRSLTQTELDLYGSSRLGIWKRAVMVANLDSTVHSSFPKSGDSLIFTRGSKLFELTNHLGNVLVTISDKRYGVSSDSMVAYYNPEVVSANDYYPFGMMQYARSWTEANVGGYRFGFNGQEKVDEIAGAGNHTTAEFWEYDPRIGRRWNLDPRPNVSLSQYSVLGNNPIGFSDPLGDTVINGQKYEAKDMKHALSFPGVTVTATVKKKPMTPTYSRAFQAQMNTRSVRLMLTGLSTVGNRLYGTPYDPYAITKLNEPDKKRIFNESSDKTIGVLFYEFVEGTGSERREFDQNTPITQEIANSYTTSLFFDYFYPLYQQGLFNDGQERVHTVFTSPDNAEGMKKAIKAGGQIFWNLSAFYTGSLDYYFKISGHTLVLRVHNEFSISSGVTRNKADDLHRVPLHDSPLGNTEQYFNFSVDLDKLKRR